VTAAEHAYVGTKPCGCITLIVMEQCRDAGREVARAIKAGDAINRMSVEAVRQIPSIRCAEHPRPATKTRTRKPATAAQGGLL
jgi:hypothetical protein